MVASRALWLLPIGVAMANDGNSSESNVGVECCNPQPTGIYVKGKHNLCVVASEVKEGAGLVLGVDRSDCRQWQNFEAVDYRNFPLCPTAWIFCHLKNRDLCITVDGDARTGDPHIPGKQLRLKHRTAYSNAKWGWDPSSHEGRLWLPGGPGGELPWNPSHKRIPGTEQCMDVKGGKEVHGTPIQSWYCRESLATQHWYVDNIVGCHEKPKLNELSSASLGNKTAGLYIV